MAGPPQLPPGVYFNPGPEECVRDYLKPWIAGGCDARAAMDGAVFPVNIYQHSPDALRRMFPAGHARGAERRWYFLTPCVRNGGRGKRGVATGGHWKVEQKSKGVADDEAPAPADGGAGGGKRRTYGFYLGDRKTAWLMEEIADREGGRDEVVPVLCRVYVSPRASDDERRAIFGEGAVAVDADGRPKPARVVLHEDYFDLLAERLAPYCVRVHGGHGHGVLPQHPGVFGHQHGHAGPQPEFLGHQYVHPAPPPPVFLPGQHHGQYAPPPVVPGHQHGQPAPPQDVLAHHQHQYQHGQPAAPQPPAVHDGYIAQAPDFQGHQYHGQNADAYHLPPPPEIVAADPPQGEEEEEEEEEEKHRGKKARLAYASPAPQPPQATGSTTPACKADPSEFQEQSVTAKHHDDDQRRDAAGAALQVQEPAPVLAPPQQSSGTGTAAPPSRPADAPAPAAEFDACKLQAPDEPVKGGSTTDSSSLTQLSFGEDFGMACESEFMLDDTSPDNFTISVDDIMQFGDDEIDFDALFLDYGPN